MKILVTGCAGFIGSNFIDYIIDNTEDEIIGVDCMTYAADKENMEHAMSSGRMSFYKVNICNKKEMRDIITVHHPDVIVNFAAESHVDNSIANPDIFIETNVNGTQNLLNLSREFNIRFHQVSTDEVYGDLPLDRPDMMFTETTPIKPSSPYSASKAAADLLVMAYFRTYGMKTSISRCSNNYGPKQHREKLIPKTISNLVIGEKIGIYGNGKNVRDWLYVEDHCDAIYKIIRTNDTIGQVYNIGGNNERTNNEIVEKICDLLVAKRDLISYISDRKGHDLRYAIDPSKIKHDLGWEPKTDFETGIMKTINWYLED